MALSGIQRLTGFNVLSFEEALEIAKERRGELCIIVRPDTKLADGRVRAQFWVLNNSRSSRSFYKKHCKQEGSLLCIAPNWFLDYLLGIHH